MAAAEDAREIADDAARPERVAVVENESGRTGRAKGVDAPEYIEGSFASGMASGDWDGDGKADLAIARGFKRHKPKGKCRKLRRAMKKCQLTCGLCGQTIASRFG